MIKLNPIHTTIRKRTMPRTVASALPRLSAPRGREGTCAACTRSVCTIKFYTSHPGVNGCPFEVLGTRLRTQRNEPATKRAAIN